MCFSHLTFMRMCKRNLKEYFNVVKFLELVNSYKLFYLKMCCVNSLMKDPFTSNVSGYLRRVNLEMI